MATTIEELLDDNSRKKVAYANSENVVTFSEFGILTYTRQIARSKFPIVLVHSSGKKSPFAMKMFPYGCDAYLNESRFLQLNHLHIASPVHAEPEVQEANEEDSTRYSFLLTEYLPNGDFCHLFLERGIKVTEKIVRSYFHQIIDGIEYLHKNKIAHLDLKLENLMFDKDYQLKIIDFDHSHCIDDTKIQATGTTGYRAPEIINRVCEDAQAADIYSAGVILFVLMTGNFPHGEDKKTQGLDFMTLLDENPVLFWQKHIEMSEDAKLHLSVEFKELYAGMTKLDPIERYNIEEIRNSAWFQGFTYSAEELKMIMLQKIEENK